MFEGSETRRAEYSFHDMIREQKMKVASLNFSQSLFYIKCHATPHPPTFVVKERRYSFFFVNFKDLFL